MARKTRPKFQTFGGLVAALKRSTIGTTNFVGMGFSPAKLMKVLNAAANANYSDFTCYLYS